MQAPGGYIPSPKFMDDPLVPRTTPGQGLLIAIDAGVSRVPLRKAMHRSSRAASVVLHNSGNTNVIEGSENSKYASRGSEAGMGKRDPLGKRLNCRFARASQVTSSTEVDTNATEARPSSIDHASINCSDFLRARNA